MAFFDAFDPKAPSAPSICHPGTRVKKLNTIKEWLLSSEGKKVLWLSGRAGTGKSTLARTVADWAAKEDLRILGATYFFSRQRDQGGASNVIPTLAYQMTRFHTEFRHSLGAALCDTESEAEDADIKGINHEAETLLSKPLKSLKIRHQKVILIVLDAIDECDNDSADPIIQQLVFLAEEFPFLRIFITGRPEAYLQETIETFPDNIRVLTLHDDFDDHETRNDIKGWLRAELEQLAKLRHITPITPDWITDAVNDLATRAENLFICADVVLQFIKSKDGVSPQSQLEIIRGTRKSNMGPYSQLDSLYRAILNRICHPDSDLAGLIRLILSAIILSRVPLNIKGLTGLTNTQQDLDDHRPRCEAEVHNALKKLGSIILLDSIDDTPRFYHQSFPDFITDHKRYASPDFELDIPLQERRLALRCFELIAIAASAGPINEQLLLPETQYACIHWSSHLCQITHDDCDSEVEAMLKPLVLEYFLWWLEAMCALDCVENCAENMWSAHKWAVRISNGFNCMTISWIDLSRRKVLGGMLLNCSMKRTTLRSG